MSEMTVKYRKIGFAASSDGQPSTCASVRLSNNLCRTFVDFLAGGVATEFWFARHFVVEGNLVIEIRDIRRSSIAPALCR